MFLAEALKERDYYNDILDFLVELLKNRSVAPKEQLAQYKRDVLVKQIEELENAFKEHQKYSILVNRAKARMIIKLNSEDFSLLDAEQLLISLRNKLAVFIDLLNNADREISSHGGIICLDESRLLEKIKMLRTDIKTIESSIDKVIWSVEI